MGKMLLLLLMASCFQLAVFIDSSASASAWCAIELECAECVPEHAPLVTSHRAEGGGGGGGGAIRMRAGDEAALHCGAAGKFLLYPLLDTLTVVCEGGQFRVRHDGTLRHLLELGCQESIFEDVLHQVDNCGSPFQGRAYQMRESSQTRHLATLCFDEDRALVKFARITSAPHNALRLAAHAHSDRAAPLSILGNFNHMFDAKTRADADKLYSDDVRMNRRLHEIFKHDIFTFADQTLTSAKLLSPHYFEDQNMGVTDFVSTRLAVWKSVAKGNLYHLHQDISKFLKMTRPHTTIDVYSGTHGVMSLRVGHGHGRGRKEIFLKPERFPVPKYIWTVVHDKQTDRALAITVLNDPFVSVSEIKDAVFCESACGRVSWLHELRRNRNYESPVYGLVFCCGVKNFTDVVSEMPTSALSVVHYGNSGMLLDVNA